jgi:hypothetical protein
MKRRESWFGGGSSTEKKRQQEKGKIWRPRKCGSSALDGGARFLKNPS